MKKNLINFYLTGREFVNGIEKEAEKKIDHITKEFYKEIKNSAEKVPVIHEKNFGRGADWLVVLVDFIIHNPYIEATTRIASFITFCKYVVGFFKKYQEEGLLLSLASGRYYSILEISKKINIENIELLHECELDKHPNGFDTKEYIYLFGINKTSYDEQEKYNEEKFYKGSIYLVHISWTGEVLDIRTY